MELDLQYSPSRWSKRLSADDVISQHINVATAASNEAKSNIPCELGVPYGTREGEKLDIFGGDSLPKESPILVYIHGGYWSSLDRTISSYCVKPFYAAGIRVVVVGYDLAPKVKLGEIIEEIQNAACYILDLASNLGSKSVWFSGHSAGGHLSAMLLSRAWMDSLSATHKVLLKGLILISGVYDLTPLLPIYVNEPLEMTRAEAVKWSPMYFDISPNAANVKIHVAVGENDSPEFQRQSKDFSNLLISKGFSCDFQLVPVVDHFDAVEKLNHDDYILTQKIINLIKQN
ncbi:kynurenine formamidase isoform X3 [Ischnura elegans]|uniref:kynurenine formamidase isoform X2 n=1 Tax=Ischnura elegans TaxID=197161 RepID=UPI001ED88082|nr:kynurenine formamidase isoform X2 [Ischnura elegans]XP_046403133.1 kynurenine formamidase isoform X2 [Ischnura elegans]XP_046403134.1 kynurenine formamidase isoform X3 [Ischnura elegans]